MTDNYKQKKAGTSGLLLFSTVSLGSSSGALLYFLNSFLYLCEIILAIEEKNP